MKLIESLCVWCGIRWVQRMVRRIRCRHEWMLHSRDRYNVMRADGSKEGEVTITLIECRKCDADKMLATDRTHAPNDKLTHEELERTY